MNKNKLDANQRKADNNIKWALWDIVGSTENSVTDGAMEESELPTFEEYVMRVYDGILNNTYGDGHVSSRPMDEIRFCTREWLIQRIEERLTSFAVNDAEYDIKQMIVAGDYIHTPRFLRVKIHDILTTGEAREQGYTEPTHYKNPCYDIFGKLIGENRMHFVAVKKYI